MVYSTITFTSTIHLTIWESKVLPLQGRFKLLYISIYNHLAYVFRFRWNGWLLSVCLLWKKPWKVVWKWSRLTRSKHSMLFYDTSYHRSTFPLVDRSSLPLLLTWILPTWSAVVKCGLDFIRVFDLRNGRCLWILIVSFGIEQKWVVSWLPRALSVNHSPGWHLTCAIILLRKEAETTYKVSNSSFFCIS